MLHRTVPICARLRFACMVAIAFVLISRNAEGAPWKDKKAPVTARWAEGEPGCTFARGDDGKYRYSLWTPDYGVILAVDSQELEKVHRRVEPFFSVELTVRYRGQSTLEVAPGSGSVVARP
jgi:hypothetical protein